jgi:hypothetical protein
VGLTVKRKRPRHHRDRPHGTREVEVLTSAEQGSVRCRHDDPAHARFDEMGPRAPHEVVGPHREHPEGPLEPLGRHLLHRDLGVRDAGVRDHDVERAEPLDRRLDHRFHLGVGGDVGEVGDRPAAGSLDLRGDRSRRFLRTSVAASRGTQVVDDDRGAKAREEQRVAPAEAPAGPGDDRNSPVEPHRHTLY